MLCSVLKNDLDYSHKSTMHELKLIKELCEILLSFEEATDAVHGEQIVTSSMVISVFVYYMQRLWVDFSSMV